MKKNAWLLMRLVDSFDVIVLGRTVPVELSGLAPGVIGATLIFDTQENAVAHSMDGDVIHKIQWEEKE
jgi:hypothetical protein